ncbi:MAG: hypothetical protein Q8Q90_03825 [bacterium]|nr:hypothetical protein [bacterium]
MEEAASFEEFKGKSFEEVHRMYERECDPAIKTFARIMLLQIAEKAVHLETVLKISEKNSPMHASAKERLELLKSKKK